MFDFIRSHQRLMQFFLLLFIVPSFALVGVSGYSNYVSNDNDLVKIGKSSVTSQEYELARANQLRQMEQSSMGGFDPEVLDNPQAKAAVLESLIDYRVMIQTATDNYFNVSDNVLRRKIASMPEFQVDGQFSPERYNEILSSAGYTTRDFEESQRGELALSRVLEPVKESASASDQVVDYIIGALTDERTVKLKKFNTVDFIDDVKINDTEIQDWYDKHKKSFEIPENADIQYILLDEETALSLVPTLSEEDLEKYYEQNKSRFTEAARVNLSHIQINVAVGATQEQKDDALSKAQEIFSKIEKDGSNFTDIAKQFSQDAGTAKTGGGLGWITQGSWPASLDRAIFALKKGQISDIIDGQGGYHIFYVNDFQEQVVQAIEDVKDTLEEEVKHQIAAERFADMATRLTSLVYDNPDSLEDVARALSIDVKTAKGVARSRLLDKDEAGENAAADLADAAILQDARVLRAVYSNQVLKDKHNSGVIEISPDTMIAVRIDKMNSAYIPELSAVSKKIEQRLRLSKARELAVSQGQDLLKELQSSTEANKMSPLLNQDNNDEFGDAIVVSRINPNGLDDLILDTALSSPSTNVPAYLGVESSNGFTLINITAASSAKADNEMKQGLAFDLSQAIGRAQEKAVLKDMRIQAEVEVLPEATQLINSSDNDS